MTFDLRMALREIRASWKRLLFFFVCIAIGVGIDRRHPIGHPERARGAQPGSAVPARRGHARAVEPAAHAAPSASGSTASSAPDASPRSPRPIEIETMRAAHSAGRR